MTQGSSQQPHVSSWPPLGVLDIQSCFTLLVIKAATEVSGLISVYHQTLDKKNRTSSQHLLMRSLFFPEGQANNFLHVIDSAGLCSHAIYHAGFPHSLTGFS